MMMMGTLGKANSTKIQRAEDGGARKVTSDLRAAGRHGSARGLWGDEPF